MHEPAKDENGPPAKRLGGRADHIRSIANKPAGLHRARQFAERLRFSEGAEAAKQASPMSFLACRRASAATKQRRHFRSQVEAQRKKTSPRRCNRTTIHLPIT
jgi:hypothetical protein